MIELIPACLNSDGSVPFDTATTTATGYIGPLGYAANQPLGTTDAVAGTDIRVNGLRFTAAGVLRLYDATAGLPAGYVVQGGMAVSSDGQLCVTSDAPDASSVFIGGVACKQDGRVHADIGSPPVTNAVIASIAGTTITVTGTTAIDISTGVWGVEYSILDNGGSLSGYTFSKNVVGQVSSQSITLVAGDGVTSDSTVTIRSYYNLDPLDGAGTRVYSNALVPVVVAGGVPSGTATEGQTLTQVQGVIAGSSPLTITYQWQNDGGTGTWANIIGETSATYLLQSSDIGDDVAVVHTGTNTAGADSERSAETGAIAANVTFQTISNVQPMVFAGASTQSGTVALTNPIASKALLVAFAYVETGQSCAFSDDTGDGVSWTVQAGPVPLGTGSVDLYLGWKQCGATNGTGKTLTITGGGTNTRWVGSVGEWSSTGVNPVFSLDGTPLAPAQVASGTNPNFGNITVTSSSALLVSYVAGDGGTNTAGSGYTRDFTNGSFTYRVAGERKIVTAGTYAADWTNAVAQRYAGFGIGFKALA